MIEISNLTKLIEQVIYETENGDKWIKNFSKSENDHPNQAVLFIKPELTQLQQSIQLEEIIDIVRNKLIDWNVDVGASRILGGKYLEKHNIMANHYGVINEISKNGYDALSQNSKKNLEELFGDTLKTSEILGGHQFLAVNDSLTAKEISEKNDQIGATKIGGGAYAIELDIDNSRYIILNAFHPFQLQEYTESDKSIVVFECNTNTNWKSLRNDLIGSTNPANASPGSIRSILLKEKDSLGISEINTGKNGVHFSAGPLEGMVELIRFFSEHESNNFINSSGTKFGKLLENNGFDQKLILKLLENPTLEYEGKKVSAFDLTEEKDAIESLELIKNIV